jgi:hypothetical protein
MASTKNSLSRLAAAIHVELNAENGREPLIEMPQVYWQRCDDLVRQSRRARLRGWHLAASELLKDLGYALPSIQHELSAIAERLPASTRVDRRATMHDVHQDLVALREEFEQLDYDRQGRWLSVATEPIVLADVYLGPFEIRLHWARLTRSEIPAYAVIAKDPHPAEGRENVTHPHVMDEVLCEGDGRHAVRQALAQARLLDFFMLVAGILRTYNPESPFVELVLWHGGSCSDCGAGVDEDHSYSCGKCGDTVCSECESVCCGCDDGCCSNCIGSCAACEDNYCRRCLQRCPGCSGSFCSGCLDDNERCPNCYEKESREDEGTSDRAAPPDGAAVQPEGLGQTLISA